MLPTLVFLDVSSVDWWGDIDLSPLRRLGRFKVYPDTTPAQMIPRSREADILITNKCLLGEKELIKLPQLKLIAVTATGVNNIDLKAAQNRGVAVTNVPGYSTKTVAEHALAFLLAFSHRLLEHHSSALSGKWSRSPLYTLVDYPFHDLNGKTLGIIGFGNIGREVARLTRGFGMKILVARIPGRNYPSSSRRLSLRGVFQKSDYVTIHCPLTKQTNQLINRSRLRWMKPTACLLNLARGPIVDEEAIANALAKNRLAGYATDVLFQEPPPRSHPLFRKNLADKVLITPHVAWASVESRQRLIDETAKNIEAFKKGKKRNRIV